MDHAGMDLGKGESQIAIITDEGELIDRRIRTERHRLVEMFGRRAPAKILMEASTESEWVVRCLEELGPRVRSGSAETSLTPRLGRSDRPAAR
jgi:hypothetical protein